MKLSIPGLCFITSKVPLAFDTDGYATSLQPLQGHQGNPQHVLVLTDVHVQGLIFLGHFLPQLTWQIIPLLPASEPNMQGKPAKAPAWKRIAIARKSIFLREK